MTRLLRTPLAVTLVVLGVLMGMPGRPAPAQVRAQDGRSPSRAAATTLALASTNTAGCASVSTCYSPHQFEEAYGIVPLLAHGLDGRGETVVLPELAEPQFPLPTSDIRADLGQFDTLFHLPAAHLRAVTTLAPAASPWLANGEEVLDTEMVHAVAPGAAIVELLVSGASLNSAANGVAASVAALRLGSTPGSVISLSAAGQTGGEGCDSHAQVAALHAALRLATARHVTVVAASGDIGAVGEPCTLVKGLIGGTFRPVKQVNLPAADPLVLAAGGTTLSASPKTGAYVGEVAWGFPYGDPGSQFQASGGGLSHVVPTPRYQNGVPGIGAYRGVPDVAADANLHTAVVTSNAGGGYTISGHGGTSASAPLWAGLVALADQDAGRHLGFVNAAIYRIAHSSAYHRPSMMSRPGTTRCASRRRPSAGTRPARAGTPSPGGGARTLASWWPCWRATSAPTMRGDCDCACAARCVRSSRTAGELGGVRRPPGVGPQSIMASDRGAASGSRKEQEDGDASGSGRR